MSLRQLPNLICIARILLVVPTALSLGIILGVIAVSVIASLAIPEKNPHENQAHLPAPETTIE